MAALSSGHLATDFANGALPALLPFFGLWSDRRGALWLLPAGVALAGSGIALASVAPTYPLVLLCVVVSGLGVAAFHPEGSKFAAFAGGRRRASAMSLFSIGGNLGFALGPTVATPLVLVFGLAGGMLLAVPCIVVAAVLLALVPFLGSFAPERGQRVRSDEPDRIGALMLLLSVIAFRSVSWFGLITFVPLWEVSLGHSKAHGNHLLSLMLLAGGLGTLAAGPLADRFGRRPVLLVSTAVTAPLILVFVAVGGAVGAIALAGVGISVISTFGVTMVMAQEYLPSRIGMASGLSIGLSIGLGGVGEVALGAV